MSRRRDIETHRRSLNEIREIMNSMKNLSYIETRKLSGFIDVQHAMIDHIETAAADFLGFHPEVLTGSTDTSSEVYLLIGSERGFCGDFNHHLQHHFAAMQTSPASEKICRIAVGHKLQMLLLDDERETIFIDGASVSEDVAEVVGQIVERLAGVQQRSGSLNLRVVYHDAEHHVIDRQVLPSFQELLHQPSEHAYPPLLNLRPRNFFLELSNHYLFLVLYEILYSSLMAESRQRVAHLDGSIERMDEQAEDLHRQANVLRQEEIIEEIEVILLNLSDRDEASSQGQRMEN